jgi:hypothetical protein
VFSLINETFSLVCTVDESAEGKRCHREPRSGGRAARVASITPSASSTPAEGLRGARLPALQAPCVPRVRPHKLSGRCLACFRVRHMWVSARSDAACVCMCARGSGNALFEHVFRSCGCHRAAAGLTSSSKDCTASFYIVAEQGIGSRGHALAVGPSHCDNWSTFGICLECLWLECTLM